MGENSLNYDRFVDLDIDKLSVIALSIKEVKTYKPKNDNTVLIRVWDILSPENRDLKLDYEDDFNKVFYFETPDEYHAEEIRGKPKGRSVEFPKKEKYDELKTFIEDNKECDFVVHCSQGVSRSSAIAYYICDVKGHYGTKKVLGKHVPYIPNPNTYYHLYNKRYITDLENIRELILENRLDNVII